MGNLKVSDAWEVFRQTYKDAVKRYIPVAKPKIPDKQPWMNQESLQTIKTRSMLGEDVRKSGITPHILST